MILVVDVLLITRLWAFYGKTRRALLFLGILWTVEVATLLTLYTLANARFAVQDVNSLQGLVPNCSRVKTPTSQKLNVSYMSVATVFQVIYLALLLYRFRLSTRCRTGHSLSPFYAIFIRDGVGYFFLIFGMNFLSLMMDKFASEILAAASAVWLVAIPSVLACRLVLNIRDIEGTNVLISTVPRVRNETQEPNATAMLQDPEYPTQYLVLKQGSEGCYSSLVVV